MNSIQSLTVFILAYNEAARIEAVINSVIDWAPEIVVINKSSTDDTAAIAKSISSKVTVADVPYSARGADDFNQYLHLASHDWIFLLVASEIVEPGLPALLQNYFQEYGTDSHDLIMTPRRYNSFGVCLDNSPWSTLYFPFTFHRRRAIVTNKLHEHFSVKSEDRRYFLKSGDKQRIVHTTHLSAESYLATMGAYFKEEVKDLQPQDIDSRYLKSIYDQFLTYEAAARKSSDLSSIMHYAAWTIYWHGVLLHACEKRLLSLDQSNRDNLPPQNYLNFLIQTTPEQRTLKNFNGLRRTISARIKNYLRLTYRTHFSNSKFARKIRQAFK